MSEVYGIVQIEMPDYANYFNTAPTSGNYTDIMVDLETLDVSPRAVILSVGAVAFNIDEVESVRDFLHGENRQQRSFAQRISLDGQLPERTVTNSTFQWWMKQSEAARDALCGEANSLFASLSDFKTWVREVSGGNDKGKVRLWGNGAAFDNAILRDAYALLHEEHPIPFRNDMCYRTVKAMLHPGKVEVEDAELLIAHNARHDAIYQAVVLQKIWAQHKARQVV